ncbi:MAG: hypothetical protein M3Y56_04755 [Armatimonadota bacterium]|nr:hypothetical protein [Armatimonadota bacterium]
MMEDVFYFTKSIVHVEDIAQLAKKQGWPCILMPFPRMVDNNIMVNQLDVEVDVPIKRGSAATPYFGNEHWFINEDIEEEYSFWEPDDIKKIRVYQPVSSLLFTYHVASLPVLGRFLKLVLERYGGWVWGSDNRIYDASNVENIKFEMIDF